MTDCPDYFLTLLHTIREWQTLIAGVLALLAAWATIASMQKNAQSADKRFREQRISAGWAARSRLPDAASTILEFLQRSQVLLLSQEDLEIQNIYPRQELAIVQNAIEFADPQSAQQLHNLAIKMQVYRSRMRDFNGTEGSSNWIDREVETAELYAIASRILDYARGAVDIVNDAPYSSTEILSGLRQSIGFSDYLDQENRFSSVLNRINQRFEM